jgi:hypothetical protein
MLKMIFIFNYTSLGAECQWKNGAEPRAGEMESAGPEGRSKKGFNGRSGVTRL